MAVTVVTDSSCDLPHELVQQWGIHVVPCGISFGDRAYRDGVNIDREEFYRLLTSSTDMPATSQPTAADFLEVYTPLMQEGREVVSVHLSAKLSATLNSATQAKKALGEDSPIELLDSQQTSMGLGLIALEAAKLASQGATSQQVTARVEQMRPQTSVFALLDTMEYVRRGGRASRAQSFLASALQIKPILTINDGETYPVSRPRTRKKGLDELAAIVQARTPLEQAAVMYSTEPEDAEALTRRIAAIIGMDVIHTRFGAVLGAHLGTRAVGLALTRAS